MWQKHKHVGREVGKFSFVGAVATVVDFACLNVGTIWLHLPLIVANLFSTTISSVVSFRLNREVTFAGQRHGHKRTIVRYIVIVGISIYVIQNVMLFILGSHLDGPVDALLKNLERGGVLPHLSTEIVNNNVSKAIAAWVASIWNFFLLRRYVFLPTNHPDADKADE